jgi:hypothetical protein
VVAAAAVEEEAEEVVAAVEAEAVEIPDHRPTKYMVEDRDRLHSVLADMVMSLRPIRPSRVNLAQWGVAHH